ncbi:MAG: DUF2382 domain-containing protein [Chloroflexota bacterium]
MRVARDQSVAAAPTPRLLPLESSPLRWERGWTIRLPVRVEHITLDKQVVVYERVLVRRQEIEERARVQASVRKEELRVSVDQDQGLSRRDL